MRLLVFGGSLPTYHIIIDRTHYWPHLFFSRHIIELSAVHIGPTMRGYRHGQTLIIYCTRFRVLLTYRAIAYVNFVLDIHTYFHALHTHAVDIEPLLQLLNNRGFSLRGLPCRANHENYLYRSTWFRLFICTLSHLFHTCTDPTYSIVS